MYSNIFWIENPIGFRLAIMARPRSGDWLEGEVENWHCNGVTDVVSLLENNEVQDLELEAEESLCISHDISFFSFPIVDRGIPSSYNETLTFIKILSERLKDGSIAIHCRAGIGRSSLIAAAILILNGVKANESLKLISEARNLQVPDTQVQIDWLREFENKLQ